jgi:succinylarginine dihydrolase
MYFEVNFDGLVGPTHNHAGLSPGNVASVANRELISNPRAAALQGLEKMRFLTRLGTRQAILPPLERPNLRALKNLGFWGSDENVLRQAYDSSPHLLAACYSASNMWTANAATVAPSCDTGDGKAHFTPANLISNFHRSLEARDTAALLRSIFQDPNHFVHHDPLPATLEFSDEGAANHIRLAPRYSSAGIHFFVYGRASSPFQTVARFPQRQTATAFEAIVRNHRLPAIQVVYAQQHPNAISAGVFHNDVISTGNLNLFLYHRDAFLDSGRVISRLKSCYSALFDLELTVFEIDQFSLEEAVATYFFNSQIINDPSNRMILIAPEECRRSKIVRNTIDQLLAETSCPLQEVCYLDLRESMRNGGGPACLRNRIVLNEDEIALLPKQLLLEETTIDLLIQWVNRHYRDHLELPDLTDPGLITEVQCALDQLTGILGLGAIYQFQK